jgi:starch synthase
VGDRTEYGRLLLTHIDETPVYLLDFPAMFNRDFMYSYGDDDARFITFSRGVMALAQHLRNSEGWNPDILHANDWHTGLVPNYLKTNDRGVLPNTAAVFTIHNLAYQGQTGLLAMQIAQLSDRTRPSTSWPAASFTPTRSARSARPTPRRL